MNKAVKISLISACALLVTGILGIVICQRIARWRFIRSMDEEVHYTLEAPRGDIYDMNGEIIATSTMVYDVHLDCALIQSEAEWKEKTLELAPRLATLLPERGAAEWWDYLQDGRHQNKRYLNIVKRITPEMKDSLAQLPIFDMKQFEGGAIYTSYEVRVYPYDSLARRAIGYVHPSGDPRVGLEGKYDLFLHGTDGYRVLTYNRTDEKRHKKETLRKEAIRGSDVYTTLSMPVQAAADSALRAILNEDEDLESGCLILMDVHTGAIRAMVNLSKGRRDIDSGKAWERYNCAIASSYEPGEVLQTMTLASVLRDRYIHSLDETVETNHGILPDYPQDVHLLDYERSNRTDCISVKEGLALSSKYVFGKLATDSYAESTQYFTEGIRSWCLPEAFSYDFDVVGFRPVDITNPKGYYWKNSTLPSVANGHALVMTPLDILSFYNTIANRGTMVQPYLVETLQKGKETTFKHTTRVLKEHAMTAAVTDTLTKALRYVTTEGTGRRQLYDANVAVAGKTGTARQILNPYDEKGLAADPYRDNEGRHKTAATYAGFFPAEAPQYSVICVLYSYPSRKTYFGGTYPAMAVRALVDRISDK